MRYTELQHNHCINNKGKSSFCIVNSNSVNSNKTCITTELANLIYNKVENNEILRIKTIKQELNKPEKGNNK